MTGVDLDIYEEVCKERDKLDGQLTEKDKQTKRLNDFIDEQRTTIAKQIVELTEKDKQIEELKKDKQIEELKKDKQIEKARSIVHRLLVQIQKHKWWDYTVIDEARAFMSEVDRDKDHD